MDSRVNSQAYVEALKLLTEGVSKLSNAIPQKIGDDQAFIALQWIEKKLETLENVVPTDEWYSNILYSHIRESLFTVQTLLENEVRISYGVYA